MGWIWANSHGSFPLGLVVLVVSLVGRWLDRTSITREVRALSWFVPGVLLGVIGPLGFRVLTFPVELLGNQEVLGDVVEWRPPTFDNPSQILFLVQLALAIVLVARQPSYRSALLLSVFAALALLGVRNVTMASLVFLPVMAPGLNGFGTLSSRDRAPGARLLGVVGVATIAALTLTRSTQTDLELRKYPVAALAYLESNDVDTREVRLAAPDFVGNLVDFVYGPERRTFYDDRFDLFPSDITQANFALLNARSTFREDLDDLDIDVVLVENPSPSGQIIVLDPAWRALFQDDDWLMSCRRGTDLGGALGTC
jgi:hypothetical protein